MSSIGDFTLGSDPCVLLCQLESRERHSDYRRTTTSYQTERGPTRRDPEVRRCRSSCLQEFTPLRGHAPSPYRETGRSQLFQWKCHSHFKLNYGPKRPHLVDAILYRASAMLLSNKQHPIVSVPTSLDSKIIIVDISSSSTTTTV